jgi:YHS domain-containing protein
MVTMASDPVCGMAVEREGAVSQERGGERFFFCSQGCRAEFLTADGQGARGWIRAASALISRRTRPASRGDSHDSPESDDTGT